MTAAQGALGLGIVLMLRDEVLKGLDKLRAKIQGFEGVSKEMTDNFDSGAKRMFGGIGLVVGGAEVKNPVFNDKTVTKANRRRTAFHQILSLFRARRPKLRPLRRPWRNFAEKQSFTSP